MTGCPRGSSSRTRSSHHYSRPPSDWGRGSHSPRSRRAGREGGECARSGESGEDRWNMSIISLSIERDGARKASLQSGL